MKSHVENETIILVPDTKAESELLADIVVRTPVLSDVQAVKLRPAAGFAAATDELAVSVHLRPGKKPG